MRGCVKAILLVLLVLSPVAAHGQCSWTPRESVAFRTTALDLSVDGAQLWLATGYGVQLLESGGSRVVDAVAIPGATRVVRADGRGYAYAGSGSRVYVLRRDGRDVTIVRSVDAGANVADILISDAYLFVATSNGIAHFDLLDPSNPVRTSAILPTSSANVTSLAAAAGKLYAADGDTTVEVFSISSPSIPQHTSELESLPRSTAVHIGADGNLLVSDAFGQNTDVFAGSTRVARLPVASNAFAPYSAGVGFAAGTDRTLRAIDFSSFAALEEHFEQQLPPTAGTDNSIHAIARSGSSVYVAAGDIGLAVFDVGGFAAPYPLISYRTTATTSTVVSNDRAWFAAANGTITEQRIGTSTLTLATERTWNGASLVHDVEGSTLLTSNGSSTTLWSLTPQTPASTATTAFRTTVRTAAIRNSEVVALLEDGSVWTGGATPQQVSLPKIAQLARSGSGYLFVEVQDVGKTVLHYFTDGNFSATPQRVTLEGVATGMVALLNGKAGVFTFAGVNVVDLAAGTVHVIPKSNNVIPKQVAFSGSSVLVLDRRTLQVYSGDTLVREQYLPADTVMLDARPDVAAIATVEGTMAVSYLATQPRSSTPFTSTFYTRLAAGGDRVYLLASDGIDVFTTFDADRPRYVTSIDRAGIVDLAAGAQALFTLSAAGRVTAFSRDGVPYAEVTLNEGSDAQPLAIDVVGNAVWVSLSTGCQSGGCQKKTLVLDPSNLGVTASLTGAVVDVTSSATRAWVLTDLPAEVRVLNITDPLHPAQLAFTAAPANATSIAGSSGNVYVTADRVYTYAESTLQLKATNFDPMTPDKAQQIRIDGNCAVITNRSASPQSYNATTLVPASVQYETPSTVRSLALQPGRLLLLTGHSLEVWSSVAPKRTKRRATD